MLLPFYLSVAAFLLPASASAGPTQLAILSMPAGVVIGAQPTAPLPSLFEVADYPPEALKNHWEGDVVADLTIDREGHVSKCDIFKSSGHVILDEKTCEVLRERARFAPAQGSNGVVEGKFRTFPFKWRI